MKKTLIIVAALVAVMGGWFLLAGNSGISPSAAETKTELSTYSVATFAGGCFWCVEHGFEKVPGVVAAVSGYSGGDEPNPTYRQVASGQTGHTESVQVFFDANIISYEGLLQAFWRNMDPTDSNGQFVDRGRQYRPAIFYHDECQKLAAEASRKALSDSKRFSKPITTEITAFKSFHEAEDYHQDYSKKNPIRYNFYTNGSGRLEFVNAAWGADLEIDYGQFGQKQSRYERPDETELRARLTALQYQVTQEEGTERPFNNAYWDEKRDGVYVDIVSGEPLFSSKDKFKSGTGWPSFTKPIMSAAVKTKTDYKIFVARTEVRSRFADSHLGHVFKDGPKPTGLRYCINSASLRFIPAEDLKAEGYGDYAGAFKVAAQ